MKTPSAESAILFAEVPNFYAEVERRGDPSLRRRPLLVGGDPRRRGKVQSVSPEGRAAGVETGMSMEDALLRCPGAIRVATDMRRYREASGELATRMRQIFDEVEPAGRGAVYADVHSGPAEPEILAARLIPQVTTQLGLPLRVGIAPSKFLARLAAEEAGPSGVFRLRAADVEAFLEPLPISRLPRVGSKTEARLGNLGALTIGDLRQLGRPVLEETFGNHGLVLLEMARGQDRSPMRLARHPRSLTRTETLSEASAEVESLAECLRRLAESLEANLERQGLVAGRLALRLRWADGSETTRSTTPSNPLSGAEEIYPEARALLARVEVSDRIRGLGITVAGLKPCREEDLQLDLFSGQRLQAELAGGGAGSGSPGSRNRGSDP